MAIIAGMNDWQKILIQQALLEDAAGQDLTALATMPSGASATARISAKADGVISGVTIADAVFTALDASIERTWLAADGDVLRCGDTVCELAGPVASLLSAERTALNFLQHLSGIATATHAFVDMVAGTGCRIADTRKTTPGFRHLEKQAVVHGGGVNHRMDLRSGMLIKENHIEACGSIAEAVHACHQAKHATWVEVECESLAEVRQAVAACPDIILLDNMSVQLVDQARAMVPPSILLEASGNITLANARIYAETGVNRIAIGAITHSAPVLDLSMRILPAYLPQALQLTEKLLQARLSTKHLGLRLLLVEETGSTNQEVMRLAEKGEPEGLVMLAERQTKGRGRLGRCWHTMPQSLAVSVLLRPSLPPGDVPQLSLLTAVALHDALKIYVPALRIKWPNDLMCHAAKLAGILTEMRTEAGSVRAVVLGFGINVNPPIDGWPADITQLAIDLTTAAGRSISRVEVVTAVLHALDYWYDLYLQQGFEPVRDAWWQAHAASDQTVRVYDGRGYIHGVARKLDHDGALLLETEQGMQRIIAGDLEIL